VVGASNSGKTTYIKNCLKLESEERRPLFLLGGDPSEYGGSESLTHLDDLTQGLSDSLSDCTLVIDDLIALSQRQHAALRKILCFVKRHKSVNVFVATHGLSHTGALSLVFHFDRVVFTKSTRNLDDFERVAKKNLLSKPSDARRAYLELVFPRCLEVDVRTGEFEIVESPSAPAPTGAPGSPSSATTAGGLGVDLVAARKKKSADDRDGESAARKRFRERLARHLLTLSSDPARSLLHLDHILVNLDDRWRVFSESDFSTVVNFRVKNKEEGQKVPASLLDFLVASQSEDGDDEASEAAFKSRNKDLIALRSYLRSLFHTPRAMIRNRHLQ